MITKKQVSKLQNAAIKATAENLAGAAKLYAAIFANCSDLKGICKELEIPVECAVKVAAIAKNKGQIVDICANMLPKVDNTFVRFALYEKEYKDKKENAEKGTPAKGDQWLKDNAITGKEYKPFGFASPITKGMDIDNRAWLFKDTDSYSVSYVAVKQSTFSVRLIAKCVSDWLSHESNQS